MEWQEYTIKEIKSYLKKENIDNIDSSLIKQLKNDGRKGVHNLANQYEKRIKRKEIKRKKWNDLNRCEKSLREKGFKYIAGIDEAGRGPLAGPVVAAAVILNPEKPILGLDDSKNLTENKREELYDIIKEKAIATGVGVVDNKTIDRINILQATYKAMRYALNNLGQVPDYVLVDGNSNIPDINIKQEAIIDGDSFVNAIAAASIVAKVYRDRLITEYADQFPEYGFRRNKGYGTREHIDALKNYGPTIIHRYSFSIVSKYNFMYYKRSILNVNNKEELNKLGQAIARIGLFSRENLKILRKLYKEQMQKIVSNR